MSRDFTPGGIIMVDDLDRFINSSDYAYEKIFGERIEDMTENTHREVDPNGKDQHDAGAKLDSGKPDCSLLGMFGRALRAVAMVGTHGANKYTRGGWQSVPNGFNRYTAAMLRHYFYENEEDYDQDLPDTLHAAQVAWNSLARLELKLREMEKANEDTTD